jgi:hypothetical protein
VLLCYTGYTHTSAYPRDPTMPSSTFVLMPPEEQAQMLGVLRRARYDYLLALHILLWCAAGRTPTDIATVLF